MTRQQSALDPVSLRHIHEMLTIPPTTVGPETPVHEIAEAVLHNPGTRLIAVIDRNRQLIGVIPVAAVAEHVLFASAPEALANPRFPRPAVAGSGGSEY